MALLFLDIATKIYVYPANKEKLKAEEKKRDGRKKRMSKILFRLFCYGKTINSELCLLNRIMVNFIQEVF